MKDCPLVTIGITCFNAENSVSRAIESALGQTYKNIEIVIVDDASTDNSVEVIRKYAENHQNIKVVCHPKNMGTPSAYNTVIDHSNGEFISFFDDDDVSFPERIEKTTLALEAYEGLAVCFCDRIIEGENNKIIKGLVTPYISSDQFMEYMLDAICYHFDPARYLRIKDFFFQIQKHEISGSSMGSGIMTAPRALFAKHLFDPKMLRYCDTEWNLRVAQDNVSAINVDEVLMEQTISSGVDKHLIKQKRSLMYAMRKHRKLYEKFSIYYPNIHFIDENKYTPSHIIISKNKPLVTVGFLTFNCEKTVYQALESVLYQTYEKIEVIVVDDGSKDATIEIVKQFEDPRIILIEQKENRGAGYNRNIVIDHAKGEYTIFFDDDDVALPNRIETQLSGLLKERNKLKGELVSIADLYHFSGKHIGVRHCLGSLGEYLNSDNLRRLVWHVILMHSESKFLLNRTKIPFHNYALGTSLMCAKTEIFKQHRFDPDFRRMQDLEFLVRFSKHGGGLINEMKPVVNIYGSPGEEKKWWRVVSFCNKLILKHPEDLEELFGLDSTQIIDRNTIKIKLMKRLELIKKYTTLFGRTF